MIGYAERACLASAHLEAYRAARAFVGRVSSHLSPAGEEIRCHELARAVVRCLRPAVPARLSLRVVDGSLWSVQHTWIEICGSPEETSLDAILDVYAPGRVPQVQLLDNHASVIVGYRPGSPRGDIREAVVEVLVAEMTAPPAFVGSTSASAGPA